MASVMNEKSFYNLDYIIEINEQRLNQYITAYHKVLGRLTHIILVYSAIAIFLIPLIQDETSFKIKNSVFIFSLITFLSLLVISSIFTIRLILPAEVAYLSTPVKYYEEYRLRYEEQLTDKTAINDFGFHITFHEDFIQKVQIVNTEKISNFMKTDSNAVRNSGDHKKSDKKSKKIQTSQLPGIDNSLVIPSWPNLIKENSRHISNKEDSEHIPKDYRK